MPSFPLWVTYSLAVIAILGPIGGAWFGALQTARRDDRRWDREREREDQRWQRENESHLKARRHEMDVQWRASRSDLYSATYSAFFQWRMKITTAFTHKVSGPLPDAEVKELIQYARQAEAQVALLALYASSGIITHVTTLSQVLSEGAYNVYTGTEFDQENWHFKSGDGLTDLLNAMRHDLGADHVDRPVPAIYYTPKSERPTSTPPSDSNC